ncbi:hypothetical protein IQ07DRAFT_590279 [Pyrenochaeta sp. DS3sAY3a]|nr:hypothetical protein IQ07DRAFT_590279 [Pyrenochaeta sp. DS3sAY3a]
MPPKPRGRGTPRGRGGARGGAAAATATPLPTTPAPPGPDATQAVQPNREDGDVAMIDSPAAEASGSQAHAEPATRAPVQRLGSLQGAVPPSRSASPSVRGRGAPTRGTRGRQGKIVPNFTGRRSKEERDALAKEAAAREKERNKEYDAATKASLSKKTMADKREADRASRQRGGYSNVASGPFSLGSSTADRASGRHRGPSGYASGSGSGSGSRAVRIKDEDNQQAGPSLSTHRPSGDRTSVKDKGKGYISSSSEDEVDLPRQDIALIEVSSDDNDATPHAAQKQRSSRATLPVRIGRKEHELRAFEINTESSMDPASKSLDQAKGQHSASGASEQNTRKGKGKATGTQPKRERSDFKGVWKEEETSEDDMFLGDTDATALSHPTTLPNDEEESLTADAENKTVPEKLKKPKNKEGKKGKKEKRKDKKDKKDKKKGKKEPKEPAEPYWVQTDRDRAEWLRMQTKRKHMRAELGPAATHGTDSAGDVNMADANDTKKVATVRDNNGYIFQVPPKMPDLVLPANYKEPSDHASGSGSVKIKHEPGDFTDPVPKPTTRSLTTPGLAGKLRVRDSGLTTLEWGSTSFSLGAQNKVSFLQEVTSVLIVPEKARVVPEDGGESTSFGRAKGNFIISPNWKIHFA